MAETIDIKVRADTAQAKRSLTELGGAMNTVAAVARNAELREFGRTVAAGFNAISRAAKSAVTETAKYAEQVRKLSYLTGAGAEETSRLIQLSDDLAIDYNELGQALKAAARQGIDPSTESLARMSDEYLRLQPGLERSQFLLDKFGRSGVALAPLLEKGSGEIRNMSAAIGDNLIMTDQQVKQMREYELVVDDFNDRLAGLKYQIGTELVSAFMAMDKPLQDFILGVGTFGSSLVNVIAGVGNLAISMRALATTMNAFAISPGGILLLAIAGGAALAALPAILGLAIGSSTGITKKLTGVDPLGDFTNRYLANSMTPATAQAGGSTLIYNNYGIDANNPNLQRALDPYIDNNARARGQR